jgi:DNA polymerase-4
MDAFFAAVEVLDHPRLRGLPVIAGGSRNGERGVVCSATYEARRFGVRSAMPASEAKRLCPDAVFMPLRFARYKDLSTKVYRIFDAFSPTVQPVSIDEAFLDLSGEFAAAQKAARAIQERIVRELGLWASVGLATSKALAKIASDLEKPKGFVVVLPGEERDFLAPLSVRRIWGVGPKAQESLGRLGIETIGDLSALGRKTLSALLGGFGERLYDLSQGVDFKKVQRREKGDRRSISGQSSFGNRVRGWDGLEERLLELAQRVTIRARDKDFLAKTLTLHVRYRDFGTASRSASMTPPTNATGPVFRKAAFLLRNLYRGGRSFTRVGIALSNLLVDEGVQLDLFTTPGKSIEERVDRVLDEVRKKLGKGALKRARLLSLGKNEYVEGVRSEGVRSREP